MSDNKRLGWAFAMSLVALLGTIAIPVLITWGFSSQLRFVSGASITLPLLAISGVIGLLAVLTMVSVAFSAIGLSKPEYALGLPEGSVRAVIALGLVVIFVTVSIFLFGEIEGDNIISRDIPESLVASLDGETISISCEGIDDTNINVCDVLTRVDKGAASEDFAKQVLTTVSTLVVAVAGFYFGARAVSAARGVAVIAPPIIRNVQPNKAKQGDELSIEILGKNFSSPKIVKLVQDSKEILCEDILSNSTKISCKLKIGEKDPTGQWNLVVVNEDGGKDQLTDAFEITAKSAE